VQDSKAFTPQGYERELTESDLRSHLSLVSDWLRMKMRSHVDPLDENTFLVQSERDVSEMVEAYLGKLFHYLFPISSPAIPPHNTSLLNREESITHGIELRQKFGLGETDDALVNSEVGPSLDQIRSQFLFWLTGSQFRQDNYRRDVWAACHLWLEKRIATGYRLLFLQGQNWQPLDATWSITRVVHDWPDTFTRSVFGSFQAGKEPLPATRPVSSLCTAICAFDNVQEKEEFESISGLGEDEYIYLWSGRRPDEPSDFKDGRLVWFKNAGPLDVGTLPAQPLQWLGNPNGVQERWNLLVSEMKKGFAPHDAAHFRKLQHRFREHLKRDSGRLSAAFSRCEETLNKVLGVVLNPSDRCFWSLQSVMFYDWKYWYLFPFSYERQSRGGLTFSSIQPLTQSQIYLTTIFMQKILQLFAETEDWARSRIRERREENLHEAAIRVHDVWTRRAGENIGITEGHEKLFRGILDEIVFDPKGSQHSSPPRFQVGHEPTYLRRTWKEGQKGNIIFAAMNYWNEAMYAQGKRVFAEWLSPSLGDDRNARWKRNWDAYQKLTGDARKTEPAYYTLNDFLFDQAARKEVLEWRGYDWQIFPRGQDKPSDWVAEPPSVTPDVRDALFKEIESGNPPSQTNNSASGYIKNLETKVRILKPGLEQHLAYYSEHLNSQTGIELGIYEGDFLCLKRVLELLNEEIQSLDDPWGGELDSSEEITSEYLIRLAIYLNTRMNNTRKENFLGVSRCAFLTWALYKHYGPNSFQVALTDADATPKTRWHFYSIPIHIPLPDQEGIQRTSILSLCTRGRLRDEELRLWGNIGAEMVLPAMMIDQRQEIRIREGQRLRAGMAVGLYHQLGQVLASARLSLDTVLDQGRRFYDTVRKSESLDSSLDEGTLFATKQWTPSKLKATKRMDRLQMFREFAFGQLTGAVREAPSASAWRIALDALEIAKEYSVGSSLAGRIEIEVSKKLETLTINEDAYGFILQEILANACRHASGENPWVRVDLVDEGGTLQIEVRNSVSEDTYAELKRVPPDVSSEPGPEKQSGRGLFGVYCLFQARKINDAPKVILGRDDANCWLAFQVPVIDFSQATVNLK